MSIKRIVVNDPSYAIDASWRWQALGSRALPVIKTLYDYPDEKPRLAALRAGAKLDDRRLGNIFTLGTGTGAGCYEFTGGTDTTLDLSSLPGRIAARPLAGFSRMHTSVCHK